MRKVLNIAFAEGNRLGVPVILETDAKSKCDKYVHLGMELAETHDLGIALSSRSEIGTTFATTHRKGCQSVFKCLLES